MADDFLATLWTITQALTIATDTWCIRSHWKELQIRFLDLLEGVSYMPYASNKWELGSKLNTSISKKPSQHLSPYNIPS